MNFRKLLTYLTVGTAAVIPFAGAQNPTILQGNYISNVFGQSNFILNPNAQTSVANVTTVTATVTRSTTTPLVATSEFTVAIGTANGTATWATRAFDAGMKGQNCEARFTYRGFAATSKVHIKQGANTVASLNLTPATDPRIASINFPCGDLSSATTFVITDTSTLGGTNEIGGIYLGLATNQANVAQAELVGGLTTSSLNSVASGSLTSFTNLTYQTGSVAAFGKATSASNTLSVTFDSLPAGEYMVVMNQPLFMYGGTGGHSCRFRIYEDTSTNSQLIAEAGSLGAAANQYVAIQANMPARFSFTTTASRTFRVQVNNNGWTASANGTCYTESSFNGGIFVYRFPTSSELVVTPERQNTFAAASWTGDFSATRTSTAEATVSAAAFATNRTAYGKAQFTGTANDVAITVENMPPGTYKIELAAEMLQAVVNASGGVDGICLFFLKDGTNTASAKAFQGVTQFTKDAVTSATQIVQYTTTATRTFTASYKSDTTNSTICSVFKPKIIITPLDQPSNSALYVQGPVLGAQTGAAIPAGYVGEVKRLSSGGAVNVPASNAWFTVGAGLPLPAGVWSCSASMAYNRNGASFTSVGNMIQTFSESSTTGSTYHWERQGIARTSDAVPTTFTSFNVGIRPIIFYSNGSQLTWPDGVQRGTNTLYTNGFLGVFTVGTPQYISETECVRIN